MIVEITDERATALIEKVSRWIVERRLAAAAILAIESFRPLHNIASQALYVVFPFAEIFVNGKEYQEFAALLEHQRYVKQLINRIDEMDEEFHRERRTEEKLLKQRRKKIRKEKIKKIIERWRKYAKG